MDACRLTATQAAARIREGKFTCEELVRSCVERIQSRDAVVRAWLHVEPDLALRQARELDKLPPQSNGPPFSGLH